MTYIAILTSMWTAMFSGTVVLIGIEHHQPVLQKLRSDQTLSNYFALTWVTALFLIAGAIWINITTTFGDFGMPWLMLALYITTTVQILRVVCRTHALISAIEQSD